MTPNDGYEAAIRRCTPVGGDANHCVAASHSRIQLARSIDGHITTTSDCLPHAGQVHPHSSPGRLISSPSKCHGENAPISIATSAYL